MEYITLVLVVIAAICNGVMDSVLNMHDTSIFADVKRFSPQFWDPTISWKNKYKNGDRTQGEAFLGSTTCFVWLTDAWHLFKVLFQVALLAAIVTYTHTFTWYYVVPVLALAWGATFEVTTRMLKQ